MLIAKSFSTYGFNIISRNMGERWIRYSKHSQLCHFSIAQYEIGSIQLGTITWGHGNIAVVIRKSIYTWISHLSSTHIDTHIWIRIHKDIGLFMDICTYIGMCYFVPFGAKNHKSTTIDPYIFPIEFVSYQKFREVFLEEIFMLKLVLTKDKTFILMSMTSTC